MIGLIGVYKLVLYISAMLLDIITVASIHVCICVDHCVRNYGSVMGNDKKALQ